MTPRPFEETDTSIPYRPHHYTYTHPRSDCNMDLAPAQSHETTDPSSLEPPKKCSRIDTIDATSPPGVKHPVILSDISPLRQLGSDQWSKDLADAIDFQQFARYFPNFSTVTVLISVSDECASEKLTRIEEEKKFLQKKADDIAFIVLREVAAEVGINNSLR